MKRAITTKLCAVVLVGMLAVLLMNYRLQVSAAKNSMVLSSEARIGQIAEMLEQNEADIQRLRESLREDYIIRTKAVAYIVENRPEIERDTEELRRVAELLQVDELHLEELRRVAELLQVDELHLFDSQGTIYSGTEPQYYGYNFHSGEQMQFFLPLLSDKSLELSQDVTPNTAEGKLMQYTALWREDGKGIVQIGMEPVRLVDAMQKNELPYLFGNMTTDPGVVLMAVDGDTGEILGCSDAALTGRRAGELGLELDGIPKSGGFTAKLDGTASFCVFRRLNDGMWLGASRTRERLYRDIPKNMVFSVLSLAAISAAIILLILSHIDHHIIKGINTIIGKLRRITDGDLDTRVEVDSSPEFAALSRHINQMVESLLESTDKLSLVFQNVEVPIAAYEFNPDMARVLATSRLGDILGLTGEETERLLADRALFQWRIGEIQTHRPEEMPEGDIFVLEGSERRFVKIRSYLDGNSTFGVVIDITEEMRERQRIAQERDVDLLTGLSSRRAFFRRMDRLYRDPGALGYTAVFMGDVDHLKEVNDGYGHEYGDRLLRAAGKLLQECEAPRKEAARLSGDEFALFLYGCADAEEAKRCLDALEERMDGEELPLPGGGRFPVRLSGGYVLSPGEGPGYRELLRLADQTMYEVKRSGKGRFARYEPR